MDTSEFDQQAHTHLNTYYAFIKGAKIVGVLVALTLTVLAVTLL